MCIRIADDERRDRVSHPFRMWKLDWQCLQGHYQRYGPELTYKPYEEPLIGSLGEPGPEQELNDEEDTRWNREQVGLEGVESQRLEGKGQVAGLRRLANDIALGPLQILSNIKALWGKHTMGTVQVKPIKYIGHLGDIRGHPVDVDIPMLTCHSRRDFPIAK